MQPHVGINSSSDDTMDIVWAKPHVPVSVDDILNGLPEDYEIQKWKNPVVHQRVLQCIEEGARERHTYKDARHIEAIHNRTDHYYKLKGVRCTPEDCWYSPSGFNDGKLFPHFDEEGVSKKLAAITKEDSPWFGMTQQDILDKFAKQRNDGAAKHAFYDKKIQQPDEVIPDQIAEIVDTTKDKGKTSFLKRVDPTPAFYRCLANMLRHFIIWDTEVTFYDEEWHIVGQADLILQDRETGLLIIADWKHCGTSDLNDLAKARGETGCHVSTVHMPNTKLSHYLVQTTIYRKIARRRTFNEWPPFAKKVILYNFNPNTPDLYETYDYPPLDLKLFFGMLPYKLDDPRHTDYSVLSTVVPRFLGTLDPRQTKTRRVAIKPGMWKDLDVAWVGRVYPALNSKKNTNDLMVAALEKGNVVEARRVFVDLEDKRKRYTLNNSPYHHPWYWMSGKDPDPAGCNSYYEWWLLNNPRCLAMLSLYVGKRITCWCPETSKSCHADILVRYVQAWEQGLWRPDLSQFLTKLNKKEKKLMEDDQTF